MEYSYLDIIYKINISMLTYSPLSSPSSYPFVQIWPCSCLRAVTLRSASISHETLFTTEVISFCLWDSEIWYQNYSILWNSYSLTKKILQTLICHPCPLYLHYYISIQLHLNLYLFLTINNWILINKYYCNF